MGKLRGFFSSQKVRIVTLAVMCFTIAGMAVFVVSASKPEAAVVASSPSGPDKAASEPSSPAPKSSRGNSGSSSSRGSSKKDVPAEEDEGYDESYRYNEVVAEILNEADASASARLAEAERIAAVQARKNQITLELARLETSIQTLQAEKITAQEKCDAAVAEWEAAIAQADEEATQAVIDKKWAEQNSKQLLALGKNPYEMIHDADNRYYAALDTIDEANAGIETAKTDNERTIALLDEQMAALNAQKSKFNQELSSLS